MPVHRVARFFLAAAAALAPAALGGCDPGTAEVSGTITVNGQPPRFKGIQIVFVPKDGKPDSAMVGENGQYKATQAPLGEVGVAFVYMPPPADTPTPTGRSKMPVPGSGPASGAAPGLCPRRCTSSPKSTGT